MGAARRLRARGRLDLFAAADGYGAFDADVTVTMDAAAGGFSAADSRRDDIQGRGGPAERGTGTLTLTGRNRYSGGTVPAGGTLVAGSEDALGHGNVRMTGGTLRVAGRLRVHGACTQDAARGRSPVRAGGKAPLTVGHRAAQALRLDAERPPAAGGTPAGPRRAPARRTVPADRGELGPAADRTRVHGRRSVGATRAAVTAAGAAAVRR
ncbi:hypothetical protein AB0L14_38850 [Streptomyces sp. NPDC052727]|uniref:hypothetical protein n=1 Tax=Streptomyces sp. NPDC052727 TaxID=3154854 RepID=UPI0034300AAE